MTFLAFLLASLLDLIIIPAVICGVLANSLIKTIAYGLLCGIAMFLVGLALLPTQLPLVYSLLPKIFAGVVWSVTAFKISSKIRKRRAKKGEAACQ